MPEGSADETFPCGCIAREYPNGRALLVQVCASAAHRAYADGAAFAREVARRSGEFRGRLDREPWEVTYHV